MGPLHGIKIIEIAGIGPGPFAAMVLSDLGADVLRIDRAQAVGGGDPASPPPDVLNRGRRSVGVDLKHPDGVATVLGLVERADALLEGFRPGVMERLGLGPDVCCARNPRLVYRRITGWGQDGPLAKAVGHDVNYIALAGALAPVGRRGEAPVPPLNLVGDFGGSGMLLALGVVAALVERATSGRGQVVDAAMVDGAALLMSMMYGFRHPGLWSDERGTNVLDTGAPFYEVHETADGKHVAIGSIERQFYTELLARSGLAGEELPHQMDRDQWPTLRRASPPSSSRRRATNGAGSGCARSRRAQQDVGAARRPISPPSTLPRSQACSISRAGASPDEDGARTRQTLRLPGDEHASLPFRSRRARGASGPNRGRRRCRSHTGRGARAAAG